MNLDSQAKWNTFLHLFFLSRNPFWKSTGNIWGEEQWCCFFEILLCPCPAHVLDSPFIFMAVSTFFLAQRGNGPDLAQQATLGKVMLWHLGHLLKGACIFVAVSRAGSMPHRRNPSSAAVDSFGVLEQSTANELPVNAPSMLMTVSKGTGDKVIFNRMSSVSEY